MHAKQACVPDFHSVVSRMDLLQRRRFQLAVMRQVVAMDRTTLTGSHLNVLNGEIHAAFLNNRSLGFKVVRAVGRWVNKGGSLPDHLFEAGAPKWLSEGLSEASTPPTRILCEGFVPAATPEMGVHGASEFHAIEVEQPPRFFTRAIRALRRFLALG